MKKIRQSLKKLSRTKKILIVLSLAILIIGLSFGCGIYFLWQTSKKIPDLEITLNNYLVYQSNKDYEKAYFLYSDEYTNYEDLDTYIKKSEYLVPGIAGYMKDSLQLEDFFVNYYIGEPITLRYQGYISYSDRKHGKITAIFILKNKKWELVNVNITAPKSRLDKYKPPQEK